MKNILIVLFLFSFNGFGQETFEFNKTTAFVSDTLYKVSDSYNSFTVDLVGNQVVHINFESEREVFRIIKGSFNEVDRSVILVLVDSRGDRYVLSVGKYFAILFDNVMLIFE